MDEEAVREEEETQSRTSDKRSNATMFLTGHRFENRAKEKKTEYASIAQLAEHAAVNRGVTGSSPV